MRIGFLTAGMLAALGIVPAFAAGGGASGARAIVLARAWSDGSCEGQRHLAGLDDRKAEALRAELGDPARDETFHIADRRDAFHALLQEAYPQEVAANAAVEVREWTFTSGGCRLTVWLHRRDSGWRSFENIRYPAGAVF